MPGCVRCRVVVGRIFKWCFELFFFGLFHGLSFSTALRVARCARAGREPGAGGLCANALSLRKDKVLFA